VLIRDRKRCAPCGARGSGTIPDLTEPAPIDPLGPTYRGGTLVARLRKEIRDRQRVGARVAQHHASRLRNVYRRAGSDGCGSITEFGRTSSTMDKNDLVHRRAVLQAS
jgi:hypothetical protein